MVDSVLTHLSVMELRMSASEESTEQVGKWSV